MSFYVFKRRSKACAAKIKPRECDHLAAMQIVLIAFPQAIVILCISRDEKNSEKQLTSVNWVHPLGQRQYLGTMNCDGRGGWWRYILGHVLSRKIQSNDDI